MSLGDLRKFLSSLESLPDSCEVKARVSFRKQLRSITIDDDDLGFQDYIAKVRLDDDDADDEARTKIRSK
jgi:hypothetical protein